MDNKDTTKRDQHNNIFIRSRSLFHFVRVRYCTLRYHTILIPSSSCVDNPFWHCEPLYATVQ